MAEVRESEQFLNKTGLQQYDALIKQDVATKIQTAISNVKVPTLTVDEATNTLIIS